MRIACLHGDTKQTECQRVLLWVMEYQGELLVGVVPQLACEVLLGQDWEPIYDVLDRVRDAEVARKKIQNWEGCLGEIEESEGSANETDGVDLSDLTSSLLFSEAQEEDPEIGVLREQAQDYRRLNAMAVFDAFPMPHVAELIERIGDARYISTLDLAKVYWQTPVAKRDRLKTAFSTPWGLYEFVRMPFGLHGTAATFQRLMDQILAPHAEYVAAYIDDIIIYTRTWEQHKSSLRAILTELRRTGLTANPQKCALAQKETKYLGFLTDTSETAVGAVLTQEEGGSERLVAYASHRLLSAEKRYLTIERECLAIRWVVDHFRYYLMGREITLVTDHAPLK
ncbi:hypothetical protein Y1Q_0004424 [Alligator mississippiensis]|uniref:ribonuclease H n=1 Tax=Alligator mississippiensis TaxID=8496 RepID=A0A151MW27_ALLMI|nr:hypothetical protein Y1Q_0004424 [Alligator mississippiensis]